MAVLRVNPTRMELKRLKNRLKTAVRGHKLLKDKSDEMIRRFLIFVKQNKKLRREVENELSDALKNFMLAKAGMDDAAVQEAVAMPSVGVELITATQNIMSLNVPELTVKAVEGDTFPYGFAGTNGELDSAISNLSGLLVKIVKLAEVEKICNMLADEIEKNRRRVNALENVMIPETQETIKYISMKLDENERANIVRLMKVKSMLENRD